METFRSSVVTLAWLTVVLLTSGPGSAELTDFRRTDMIYRKILGDNNLLDIRKLHNRGLRESRPTQHASTVDEDAEKGPGQQLSWGARRRHLTETDNLSEGGEGSEAGQGEDGDDSSERGDDRDKQSSPKVQEDTRETPAVENTSEAEEASQSEATDASPSADDETAGSESHVKWFKSALPRAERYVKGNPTKYNPLDVMSLQLERQSELHSGAMVRSQAIYGMPMCV